MVLTHDDLLAHLSRESGMLGAAIETGDLDAPVAACPGWTLRDLVLHTGRIHRWALTRTTGAEREPKRDLTDPEIAPWFADGARRLHAALLAADPSTRCQGFEGEVDLAFWIRRQAHETAMHRVDAQATAGTPDAIAADLAADGIAEVLEVFLPRQTALGRTGLPPYGLVLITPDGTWRVDGPDPVTVRGSSSDVLLMLWRRPAQVQASDEEALRVALAVGFTP